ncbi:MAG: nitrogen fixation protein FixH [Curvibacter sp. GWA2_64_110]|nr:MAG: nitrogen fixation protein FixH [Curvibacter sp. GWA2_64_110]HCY15132.1 nitrogen fixation protein FixH [Curvibacter sp.]
MSKSAHVMAQPWWKFVHVWMVLAGPAVVVVAGFVTLYLAVHTPDPVVSEDYYRQGIEINKTLEAAPSSLAPAIQARNHAATGVAPAAKPSPQP